MPDTTSKLKLPNIKKVSLRRFSLFAANPDAEFSCDRRVLCLVGANGVGKSTLLTAINFCLTGIVSDPSRSFESMEEYYKYTKGYAAGYFRGRINGTDQEDAEIALHFAIGDLDYKVRRGMFEPEELRTLRITNTRTNQPVSETDEMPPGERHRLYMTSLVEHIGLASFEEFVFLQHFVFTFDEQRKTLFWSPRIMERVLYRAFGLDPNMAKQADTARREIDRADSRVRNYQWEATRMRKRINEIRSKVHAVAGAQNQYDTLVGDHEELSKQFEQDSKRLREAEDALRDANLQLADHSVRETALREAYSKFFDRRFDLRPPVAQHPLVVQSLTDRTCGLCGTKGKKVVEAITEKSTGEVCPLCDSPPRITDDDSVQTHRLQAIDRELAEVRRTIKDIHKTLNTLRTVEAKARKNWASTKEQLDQFDRENTTTLEGLRQALHAGSTEGSLKEYREQLAALEIEKQDAYSRREHLKGQLTTLQRDLESHYLTVEKHFVPLFARLAHNFLGMPLSVEMDARASDDVKLVVTVRGTTRRLQQNLSESQRFFLDIALRMALTQHMSHPEAAGGMFIDTPEGSLDIAYEKRAGDMLAQFAQAGHQIIMTANLNSSQLLLALAKQCTQTGMQLCRMTDWAELSVVQQEEEALFDKAYADIEGAMKPAN